jgi:3-phosphoshikimate 1-carboxyvinyltransferase
MTSPMRVDPARGPLRGVIEVPGDKSVSHRAFLVNALGRGSARIRGALQSDDVEASRRLARAVGCQVHADGADWVVRPPDRLQEPDEVIDCGNSGTTMRLGAGLLAHVDGLSVLSGDGSLRRRPMKRVLDPLRAMGVLADGRQGGALAPFTLRGGRLTRAEHRLSVASAQVKSAVLLAGRDVGVRVEEPGASRDHTERLILAMGGRLTRGDGWCELEGGPWDCVDLTVPGDLSSAAFWMVAAAIVPGSRLELPGVGVNPTRAGVLDALTAMGVSLSIEAVADGVEPLAHITVEAADLRGSRIDGALALRCLDELPVLAVAAACASGPTVFADARELRVKESDRITKVVAGLRALGADVDERPDGMVFGGGGFRRPGTNGPVRIDANGDHRLVMAFAVAGLVASGVELLGADEVRTSYPAFFEHLRRLA